jgi:hypothetical protein
VARHFDGTDDVLTVSAGGMSAIDGGAVTVAFILKFNDVNNGSIIYAKTSGAALVFQINADGGTWFYETTDSFRSMGTAATADNWHLFAVTKTNGNSTPRSHKYVYDTNTFSHADASSAFNDSSAAIGSGGSVQFGRYGSTSEYANMELALAGVWDRVLTDAEFENLAFSLQQWYASAPAAMWRFDQSAVGQTVADLVGGANQSAITGTAVSTASVPVFSYGYPIPVITNAAASDATIEPAVITATTSMPAPTVTAGSSVSPAVISAAVSMPAPSVVAETTVSPEVIAASVSMPAPTLQAGQTASPAAISCTVTMPAATPSAGQTVTPAVVSATVSMPVPTVTAGAAVSPSAIAVAVSMPAPDVVAVTSVSPDVIAVATAIPAPSLQTGSTVTPIVIAVATSMPTPTIQAGGSAQISAEVIAVAVTMPAATPSGGATVAPAAISATVSLPAPSLTTGSTVTAPVISVAVTFPSFTVQVGEVVPATPAVTYARPERLIYGRPGPAAYQRPQTAQYRRS